MIIVQDSREQAPFKFRESKNVEGVEVRKLDVGDYSISGMEHQIAIERKNSLDFFGTLGKGHERFRRELERAKNHEYFAIVVEAPFRAIRDKDFEGAYNSKMRGDVIVSIALTLKLKYKIDVIFAQDREEAASITRALLWSFYKMKKAEEKWYKVSVSDNKLPAGLYYDVATQDI